MLQSGEEDGSMGLHHNGWLRSSQIQGYRPGCVRRNCKRRSTRAIPLTEHRSLRGIHCYLDAHADSQAKGAVVGGGCRHTRSEPHTCQHIHVRTAMLTGWCCAQTWITATQAMYLVGGFSPGKSILWHAGASSVSIAGIQLSRADNASAIFITAGSEEKIQFCSGLGATAGFNYHTQNWAQEILKATGGKGVDVVIDFVGQNHFQGNLDVAARDGHIVHLGALSGTKLPAGVDIGAFVQKRIRFEGSSLRSRDVEYQRKLRNTLVEHALPKLVSGSFQVPIEKVFGWADVVQAHELMESNQTMGKIICRVD